MELYTVKQAAEYLQVSEVTLRHWIRTGKLKAHKLPNNKYRVSEENLKELLEGGEGNDNTTE